MAKKKFAETKVGKLWKDKAQTGVNSIGDIVPDQGGVGIVKNIKDIIEIKAKVNDCLLLIGGIPNHLGQSAFFREVLKISGEKAGPVPKINYENEKNVANFIQPINQKELIDEGHDM